MNKEELEILINKMYYDYVDREEAQKIIDYINNFEKENQELKRNCNIGNENLNFYREENKQLKERIDKAIEYLTSYSSIHTIQFGTENDSLNDIELNKTLDEKTLNEMTNRYLLVHDNLLDILKEVSE